jgi:prophage regulatory protein
MIQPNAACQPANADLALPSVKDRRKDRLLRLRAVIDRTGLSRMTINRREAAGTFPKRELLGARCVGWYESDVEDFVANPAGYRRC